MISERSHKYLLVLSCSAAKKQAPDLLPAIERYDGPAYKVLRKARREGRWPPGADILILSAKFGWLRGDTLIENYDQRMGRVDAEVQQRLSNQLEARVRRYGYESVYVNLGKDYLRACGLSEQPTRIADAPVTYAAGGIGHRLAQMKAWLEEMISPLPAREMV